MSKRAVRPQSRRHVFIYDEDWEFLEEHFGALSVARVGVSTTIKEIVHKHVGFLRSRIFERETAHGASMEDTI